ncbi:hypothetical protein AKJ09_04425 [Labilithrix luteola]|uniref:Uncharacterized protein n=1 Tax=Labilithrix luteola TaxID=1391654 RepID=A0A0K1PWL3_9BACT|nr:hypothetical protein AKJ09_04425 [Labilithrix luteola]
MTILTNTLVLAHARTLGRAFYRPIAPSNVELRTSGRLSPPDGARRLR